MPTDATDRPLAEGRGPSEMDPGGPSSADDGRASGLHVRLLRLLVSPGALFDELREHPVWLDALLLSMVLTLATVVAIPDEIFRQAMVSEVPAEADPADVERMLRFTSIMSYVFGVLVPVILALVVAGLLALIFDIGLGGRAGFRRLFSATTHGLLISTLGGVVAVPLVIATGDLQTTLGLHLLVPGLEEGYAYRLLSGLNVFSLWTCAVLGVAVDRFYPRRSAASAAALLLALYVGFRAITAIFGG